MNSCALNRLVNIPGLAISILLGTLVLYVHNNLLPFFYIIFAVCVIIAHAYLYCTRCVNHGKDCYMFGGRISKRFFKGRHEGPIDLEDSLLASLWILLAVFPVPFLLYYQDFALTALYIVVFWGWFYMHKQTACADCNNLWCGLNGKRRS